MKPTVSVVVPTYNSASSIRDTLLSVQSQTLCAYEVIVVNDGSTDNLEMVLAPFLQSDARLRVVTQQNLGLAAARNRGLSEARADLVSFIDADDIWHPQFLERLVGALRENPGAPFAYSLMMRIDEHNRVIPTPAWTRQPRHDLVGLIELNSVGNGSASVFRRKAVVDAGGFDTTLRDRKAQGAEDWKLILTLASQSPPVLVSEQLMAYRVVDSSMSRSKPDEQLRGVRAVLDEVRLAHPDVPARHFRNARTVMNGWILPAFLAQGRWVDVGRLLFESYALNPLFFLSGDVRTLHWHKIQSIAGDLRPRIHIADYKDAKGSRPYAFLA